MAKNQNETVQAWVEDLTIPTYPAQEADRNPMFFENRNIQGAKGNIYPSPFTDQLTSVKVDKVYKAVYLENEYIQLIMLPEIGGRIFTGLDKTNSYDFFYRHTVIKPALIGVYGPWISGGVEFNWPQHHRPSTYSPVDFTIEEHPDGSKTVWLSEHDPFDRTKGMVGICLYPGKAIVETKVRLFNRTSIPHTFLWWENTGVHINEQYQVIFPPDVHWTVYHTKAHVKPYPILSGQFGQGGNYSESTDVSWYVNSPMPNSFFAGDSKYEFFGGYDHSKKSGVVHYANRHIAPGKKYFTWGHGPFGNRWQRNLMDDEGEYLELMAGAYTDNQPDFSWIMPYETRIFSQFWYPIQQIGSMKNANTLAAINLEFHESSAFIGAYATEKFEKAKIILTSPGQTWFEQETDLGPGLAFTREIALPAGITETDLLLRLVDADGEEIIRYIPEGPWDGQMPEPYQPPAAPENVSSVEELYLIGLHLEQYRHPFLSPLPYWQEALRRDPGDSRTLIALGRDAFRRGEAEKAEGFFRAAVKRLTSRNFNPYDGEAHYFLGLTLQANDKLDEAYDVLYKATWNYAWQAAAFYRLALIDTKRGNFLTALAHIERSLQTNSLNTKVRCLKSAILRHLNHLEEAEALIMETVALDPLDTWARHELMLIARESGKPRVAQQRLDELHRMMRGEVQTYLDVALDYASAGLYEDTFPLVGFMATDPTPYPMVAYILGYFAKKLGQDNVCIDWYKRGAEADPEYCFPWRLEEMQVLLDVLNDNPQDGRAHYYLGNLLYDKKHYSRAVEHWKASVALEPSFAIPWRNLALAAYNQDHDIDAALEYIYHAFNANPNDPRILLEYDQLLYRKACSPQERLALLEDYMPLVEKRDDLVSQVVMLHNCCGQPEKALEIAAKRAFHPWEGGEGSVAEHYANAHWMLGRQALEMGDPATALTHFKTGVTFPDNLGEVLWESETIHLDYFTGLAYAAMGNDESARIAFEKVAAASGDLSLAAYYRGLALQQLGKNNEAKAVLQDLLKKASELAANPPGSNYFYYGNPSPVFDDDPKKLQHIYFTFLAGMARQALGDKIGARSALAQVLAVDPTRLLAYEEFKRL
jgi:tetratricopeptide (TPR) repeat protein